MINHAFFHSESGSGEQTPVPGYCQIRDNQRRYGFAMLEYLVLLLVVMGTFIMMNSYVQSAFQGHFRKTGTALGQMRQYDPDRTRDCAWHGRQKIWYSERCFDFKKSGSTVYADNPTQTVYCSDNLSPTYAATCVGAFLATCPMTCEQAKWRTECHGPCQGAATP